jgi:hypothetical protein
LVIRLPGIDSGGGGDYQRQANHKRGGNHHAQTPKFFGSLAQRFFVWHAIGLTVGPAAWQSAAEEQFSDAERKNILAKCSVATPHRGGVKRGKAHSHGNPAVFSQSLHHTCHNFLPQILRNVEVTSRRPPAG